MAGRDKREYSQKSEIPARLVLKKKFLIKKYTCVLQRASLSWCNNDNVAKTANIKTNGRRMQETRRQRKNAGDVSERNVAKLLSPRRERSARGEVGLIIQASRARETKPNVFNQLISTDQTVLHCILVVLPVPIIWAKRKELWLCTSDTPSTWATQKFKIINLRK